MEYKGGKERRRGGETVRGINRDLKHTKRESGHQRQSWTSLHTHDILCNSFVYFCVLTLSSVSLMFLDDVRDLGQFVLRADSLPPCDLEDCA